MILGGGGVLIYVYVGVTQLWAMQLKVVKVEKDILTTATN